VNLRITLVEHGGAPLSCLLRAIPENGGNNPGRVPKRACGGRSADTPARPRLCPATRRQICARAFRPAIRRTSQRPFGSRGSPVETRRPIGGFRRMQTRQHTPLTRLLWTRPRQASACLRLARKGAAHQLYPMSLATTTRGHRGGVTACQGGRRSPARAPVCDYLHKAARKAPFGRLRPRRSRSDSLES
jgi:hypothetical protein